MDERDPETLLIERCVEAFLDASLDRGGDQRVLEYLAQRWGPAAYEGGDEGEGDGDGAHD